MIDALIVGGGPAGLSVALLLGRARRSVLLSDMGDGRNKTTHASHSFFTRDGSSPQELRTVGNDQLNPYPSVERTPVGVESITGEFGDFIATLADGTTVPSRSVILATGVADQLPAISGLREAWGRGVYQCPFCDGWEHRDEPMAVFAERDSPLVHVEMMANWSRDLVVLTNGSLDILSAEDFARLQDLGTTARTEAIASIKSDDNGVSGVEFEDGSPISVRSIWLRSHPVVRNQFAVDLGCTLYDSPMASGLVQVDQMGQTTVPGVFAAGDVITPMAQIAFAVASGSMAGMGVHRALMVADANT